MLDSLYKFEKLDPNNKEQLNKLLSEIKSTKKDSKEPLEAVQTWETETLKEIITLGKCLDIANIDILLAVKSPISMKQMNFSGADLQGLGVPPGRLFGDTLKALHIAVINGEVENNKEALIEKAKKILGIDDSEPVDVPLSNPTPKQARIKRRVMMIKLSTNDPNS